MVCAAFCVRRTYTVYTRAQLVYPGRAPEGCRCTCVRLLVVFSPFDRRDYDYDNRRTRTLITHATLVQENKNPPVGSVFHRFFSLLNPSRFRTAEARVIRRSERARLPLPREVNLFRSVVFVRVS